MAFPVEFGIMREAVLDGAPHNGLSVNDAVGLRHDASVDAARFVVGRCTVVFRRPGHDFNLLRGKPEAQLFVAADYASGYEMMGFAPFAQTGIVVCRDGIDHVAVERLTFAPCIYFVSKHKALFDDGSHMVCFMGVVEMPVTGNYFRLDIFVQGHR